ESHPLIAVILLLGQFLREECFGLDSVSKILPIAAFREFRPLYAIDRLPTPCFFHEFCCSSTHLPWEELSELGENFRFGCRPLGGDGCPKEGSRAHAIHGGTCQTFSNRVGVLGARPG